MSDETMTALHEAELDLANERTAKALVEVARLQEERETYRRAWNRSDAELAASREQTAAAERERDEAHVLLGKSQLRAESAERERDEARDDLKFTEASRADYFKRMTAAEREVTKLRERVGELANLLEQWVELAHEFNCDGDGDVNDCPEGCAEAIGIVRLARAALLPTPPPRAAEAPVPACPQWKDRYHRPSTDRNGRCRCGFDHAAPPAAPQAHWEVRGKDVTLVAAETRGISDECGTCDDKAECLQRGQCLRYVVLGAPPAAPAGKGSNPWRTLCACVVGDERNCRIHTGGGRP